jgi:hypothetical protein
MAMDIRLSISQLAGALKAFEIQAIEKHRKCFGIDEMHRSVAAVLSSIESPVLDSHRQHFLIQKEVGN